MWRNRKFLLASLALALVGILFWTTISQGSPATIAKSNGRMSQEILISPIQSPIDANRNMPAAAFNDEYNEFLVVWHNQWPGGEKDIYAQRVKANGQKVGPWFCVTTGSGDRVQPVVAYNSVEGLYLVVFMQDVSGNGSRYEINGQFVGWDGAILGNPFTIQTLASTTYLNPRIAYNPVLNEYSVVYVAINIATQKSIGIQMKILDHFGSVTHTSLVTDQGFPSAPDLYWNPIHGHYVVVWQYENADGKQSIAGDFRNRYGHQIAPPGVIEIFNSSTNSALSPRVAYSSGIYAVVHEYESSLTDHDIITGLVSWDGNFLERYIINDSELYETHPVIAGNINEPPLANVGNFPNLNFEFLVLYQQNGDINNGIWLSPFSKYLNFGAQEVSSFWDYKDPSITKGGAGYLLTYTTNTLGNPSMNQRVFGRMFWSHITHLPVVIK